MKSAPESNNPSEARVKKCEAKNSLLMEEHRRYPKIYTELKLKTEKENKLGKHFQVQF